MALRFDKFRLDEPRRDDDGYLIADAHVTRTGVFVYHHPDGTVTRELRHPDDILKQDSVMSLKNRPITDGHPLEGKVTSRNSKRLAVGMAIDDPTHDGKFIKAKLQITDESTIDKVLDSDKPIRELSCGYEAKIIKEEGTYQGEKYDHRQTNVRYNHIALVPRGRAGPEVRLQLDSADAAGDGLEDMLKQDVEETEENIHIPVKGGESFKEGSFRTTNVKGAEGVQLVIGRLKNPPEGEEGSAVAQKFIFSKKHFTMEQAKAWMAKHKKDEAELVKDAEIGKNPESKHSTPRGDSDMITKSYGAIKTKSFKLDAVDIKIDEGTESADKAVQVMQERIDSCIAHIEKMEGAQEKMEGRLSAMREDGKVSLGQLNDLVKERTDAINAAHYLGLKDYMGLETDDLKKAVVMKAYPSVKIDELTKDHIEGRYDTIIESISQETSNLKSMMDLKPRAGQDSKFPMRNDDMDPRSRFLEDTKDMYKTPAQKQLDS